MLSTCLSGRRYRVTGLVQGVGFRPTVWRLAQQCGLAGHVLNDAGGVEIVAYGEVSALARFENLIKADAPPLARIDTVISADIAPNPAVRAFTILESRSGPISTGIVPDAAICDACLGDIADPDNRRFGYAFTNCTHCGPRLSIVHAIPYDRANTSMSAFPMCDGCEAEYADPSDRRFHAQPNACPVCGPKVWLEDVDGFVSESNALGMAAEWLRSGKIVAVKGVGGFHLACDATNEAAVAQLRDRKHRPSKPLAVMVRDIAVARHYAQVSEREAALMHSHEAPIVLVRRREGADLASSIAPEQNMVGLMLPYSPLHALLLKQLDFPLVMTSGNRSNEPQVITNDDAKMRLSGIADGWLVHDRDIVNRLDDSVVRPDHGAMQILRRARGYAPAPLPLHEGFARSKRVLAMGGELKSTFCLLVNGQATLSQHMGDLEEARTFDDYRRNLQLYFKLFDFMPEVIAVDRHPDYLSTQLGRQMAEELGVPVIAVQHHHAHFAACLADNGLSPDTRTLGIILDGLGLGDDGTFWGGEILSGSCRQFTRHAHFLPVAMPGGAIAAREPWRNLVAHLRAAYGELWGESGIGRALVEKIDRGKIRITEQMIVRRFNSPLASSAGRFFDAVAAALDVCADRQEYEGQAGMQLEALAALHVGEVEPYPVEQDVDHTPVMSWKPLWDGIARDLSEDMPASYIAARFHHSLIEVLVGAVSKLANETGIRKVILSGGVMNNALLFDGLCDALAGACLEPLVHRAAPANDGGLSLGQAVVVSNMHGS